ncbi:MAG: glycosyltransferase [Actinobacteria bacterium]|nr:glycosyltransferase [Actinomycetota bacterium]
MTDPRDPSPAASPSAPTVSVVMPVGAIDDSVTEQLDALADQSFSEPWELVLSVNAPGQSAHRVLTDHRVHGVAAVRIIDSSAVRSAAHARNAGAAAASTPLLAFCDSDDLCEPTWLAAIVRALGAHEAVGGHLDEQRLSPPGQERWRPPATPGDLPAFLGHRYPVSANMGVRAEAFAKVNGFPVGYTRCEDIAFGWLLEDAGIELAYAPDAVVHYRHRPGLWTMIRQHHYYGVGMTEVLVRQGIPGAGTGADGASLMRPNAQRVTQRSFIHILRRGAIASGRVRGLVQERILTRDTTDDARR